jgi:DNA polymerase III subunit delta
VPALSPADVRSQIAAGSVGPVYLILGQDEAGKVGLAGDFLELVEPDLRPFNVDRLYGGETTARAVVDAARTLPMMVPRRVVLVLHAERLLMPKKESEAAARDLEGLEAYVKAPFDSACLVLVAESVDKRRSLTKTLLLKATVVECTGPSNSAEAARWVRDRVAQDGMAIDARAARLVADRVGLDFGRLRSDVERLILYATGNNAITEADVREVVGAATSQDDWGVTTAIERGAAGEALRELALLMEGGAVPYMILGQLAWFVRTKVPAQRVPSAVEAVFRTDLAIKTSAGDPRVLLERLVVELCVR